MDIDNFRGIITSPPSAARAVSSPTPGMINFTHASVANPATPTGQGEGDLWSQVVKGAQQSEAKYGIPAALTLAQFFQETGGGKHFVGNNIFGIKGTGPGGSVKALTWEQGADGPHQTYANFRAYKNVAESIEDHARLLVENPAYKKLQSLIATGVNNPDTFADALQGIYATDPNYANALKSHMRKHDLVQYDNQAQVTKPSPIGNVQAGGPQIPQAQPGKQIAMAGQPQTNSGAPMSPSSQAPQTPTYSQDSWLNDKITQALKGQPQPQMNEQPVQQQAPAPRPVQPVGQLPEAPQSQMPSYQIPTPNIGGGTQAPSTGGIPMPVIGRGTA